MARNYLVLAASILCLQVGLPVFAIQCWKGTSDTPELPQPGKTVQCETGCQKKYMLGSTQQLDGQWKDSPGYFLWGCIDEVPGSQCGDTIESKKSPGQNGQGQITTLYERTCTCCGDKCNGKVMDNLCDGKPQYDHKCYMGMMTEPNSSPEPKMLEDVITVGCTKNMPCLKGYSEDSSVQNTYFWSCASHPLSGCPSTYKYSRNGKGGKMCSCCGSECNGASFSCRDTDSPDPEYRPNEETGHGAASQSCLAPGLLALSLVTALLF